MLVGDESESSSDGSDDEDIAHGDEDEMAVATGQLNNPDPQEPAQDPLPDINVEDDSDLPAVSVSSYSWAITKPWNA